MNDSSSGVSESDEAPLPEALGEYGRQRFKKG
jgi:hypothetical protein